MSTTTRTEHDLVSYSQAGRLLGVTRWTITDLVEKNELVPKPVSWNNKAKGLDAADLAILRRALEPVRNPSGPL